MRPPRHAGFRKRNAQALYEMHYGPNMTPMVDVVMVILIFFMASAVVLGPEWFVRSNLPRPGGATTVIPAVEPLRLRLRLSRDASDTTTMVRVNNDSEMDASAVPAVLRAALKTREPNDIIVLIEPEANVAYEEVVRVHAQCQQLGLVKVGLITPGTK
jgi:biopolymer transport protein ExbD